MKLTGKDKYVSMEREDQEVSLGNKRIRFATNFLGPFHYKITAATVLR